MILQLVRHTPPEVDAGVCYGFTDLDVDARFDQHLERIRTCLNERGFERIYSSPLKRCARLADALWEHRSVVWDDRLKEMNFGAWEMLPWSAIPVEVLTHWADDLWHYAPPGGESFGDFHERVMPFFNDLFSNPTDDSLVVVTHSGVIRCVLMHCLQVPASHIFNLDLPYGCVVEVVLNGDNFRVRFVKI